MTTMGKVAVLVKLRSFALARARDARRPHDTAPAAGAAEVVALYAPALATGPQRPRSVLATVDHDPRSRPPGHKRLKGMGSRIGPAEQISWGCPASG